MQYNLLGTDVLHSGMISAILQQCVGTTRYRGLTTEHTPRYDGAGWDSVTGGQTDTSGLYSPAQRQIQSCCYCSSCWSLLGSVDCSWEGRSIAHTKAILTQDKHNHASRLLLAPLLTRESQTEARKLLGNTQSICTFMLDYTARDNICIHFLYYTWLAVCLLYFLSLIWNCFY